MENVTIPKTLFDGMIEELKNSIRSDDDLGFDEYKFRFDLMRYAVEKLGYGDDIGEILWTGNLGAYWATRRCKGKELTELEELQIDSLKYLINMFPDKRIKFLSPQISYLRRSLIDGDFMTAMRFNRIFGLTYEDYKAYDSKILHTDTDRKLIEYEERRKSHVSDWKEANEKYPEMAEWYRDVLGWPSSI